MHIYPDLKSLNLCCIWVFFSDYWAACSWHHAVQYQTMKPTLFYVTDKTGSPQIVMHINHTSSAQSDLFYIIGVCTNWAFISVCLPCVCQWAVHPFKDTLLLCWPPKRQKFQFLHRLQTHRKMESEKRGVGWRCKRMREFRKESSDAISPLRVTRVIVMCQSV